MNSFHDRVDVRNYLEQFTNHQVYFYMQEKYHEITEDGDKSEEPGGKKYHDEVAKLAAEKFSMSTEMVESIFTELDLKATNFMIENK